MTDLHLKNWLTARLGTLLEVLHSPEAAFARDLSGPSFIVPLVVLGLLFASLATLQSPIQLAWAERQMETRGISDEAIATSLESMRKYNTVGAVIVPLLLLAKWALFAALLWLTAQLACDSLDFGSILNLVAYAYIPIGFRDLAIYLVLLLRSGEALARADGLTVSLGLNLVFPSIRLPWAVLAANVNAFELWHGLLLVVGLAKLTSIRWQRAFAVVLPNWLFVALVQVGIASLGLSLQSALKS